MKIATGAMTVPDIAQAVTGPSAGGGPGTAGVDQRVWKAAKDFEAMAIGQMLEPMFSTVDTTKGEFGGGVGEQNFKPMLVGEMAKAVEQRGGLGLAAPVYAQMLKMQEKAK